MTTPTPAPAPMTARLRELMEEATPGPWQVMREGNQYVDCNRLTPRLVAASRVHGVQRPWNPYAATRFGLTPEHHEAVRFKDADADLIVHLRNNAPTILRLLEAVEGAEEALSEIATGAFPGASTAAVAGPAAFAAKLQSLADSALATLRAAREVKP